MIQSVIHEEVELILNSSLFLDKVLPKSISTRFFWILTTPVILSQIIFGVLFFGKYTESVMKTMADQMAGDVWVVSSVLDLRTLSKSSESELLEGKTEHRSAAYLGVREHSSTGLTNQEDDCGEFGKSPIGYSDSFILQLQRKMNIDISILENTHLGAKGIEKNNKVYRRLRNAFHNKEIFNYYIKQFDNKIMVYIAAQNNRDVYKISFPRRSMYTRIIPIVLGWGLASSIVLLIIAFIFLKNQLRPIKKLAVAVDEFGRGVDTNNFKPEGAKEIRMAGAAFCDMKANFRALMNDRLKTLAGISHDLRTPLTKMKLQLSLMNTTEEIELLKKDIDTIVKITENFTLHAANQNKEMFAHWNLGKFLRELANEYTTGDFNVLIEGDRAIEVYIKYISLKRAFGNIISNAKKYASNIYIYFMAKDDGIIFQFEDDGPGISLDIMDDIFTPFVCGNQARTHEDDEIGVGLGLSIARDVITDHGGEISVSRSKDHGGATFIVLLPRG
ncbi:MAG: palindromic element RPE1 domain-containing protein [Holosporales bacterium]|nr:palindromic element RPE1 domain-containing protein [Holosporales bacterium]